MATLVLVRHGQASFGARNYDLLSPTGERQSSLLGEHWLRCGFAFDAAFAGTMQRQRVTAERALAAMGREPAELRIDAAFDEYDHQGLIRAYLPAIARAHPEFSLPSKSLLGDPGQFQKVFNLIVAAWMNGTDVEAPIPETWPVFRARCVAGLREVATREERTVVFTSGGVITAALCEALGIDHATALQLNWNILNTSVHVFGVSPRRLSMRSYNELAHLQASRDEHLLTFR